VCRDATAQRGSLLRTHSSVSQVGAAGVLLDAQVAPEDRDAEGSVLVVIVEVAVALGFHSSPFLSPGVAVPLVLERDPMAGFGARAVAKHKVSAYHEICG
jgi:hypothetical protein